MLLMLLVMLVVLLAAVHCASTAAAVVGVGLLPGFLSWFPHPTRGWLRAARSQLWQLNSAHQLHSNAPHTRKLVGWGGRGGSVSVIPFPLAHPS